MTVKACFTTPLLHLAEIERSQKFWKLLGFETLDTGSLSAHRSGSHALLKAAP